MELRRNLNSTSLREWGDINDLLQNFSLDNQGDVVCWAFEKSGKYSCKSMYRHLSLIAISFVLGL